MKWNSIKFHQATIVSVKLKATCYVSRGIGEQPSIITEEKAKQGSDTLGRNNLEVCTWESSVF